MPYGSEYMGSGADAGQGAGGFQDFIAGIAGFAFGTGKKTGSGKAAAKSRAIQELAFRQSLSQQSRSVEQFLQLAPSLARSAQMTAMQNPVYAALQGALVADIRNKGADPALSAAFENSVRSQLAARGVLTSPHTAIGQSLAVLQFNEALRQQSIQNAGQFLGVRSPTQIGMNDLGAAQLQGGQGMEAGMGFAQNLYQNVWGQQNATQQNRFNATNAFGSSVSKLMSDPGGWYKPQQVGGG